MIVHAIRTLILYLSIVTVMRLMGKRQIGQMQPYELVLAILIAELVAVPMEDIAVPLLAGIVPVLVVFAVELIVSYVTLKSELARKIICGTPTVIIEHGKFVEAELKKSRININDLMEQLRMKNYADIADVEFAILETGGQLSVIAKAEKRPLTAEDVRLNTTTSKMPITLILDGRVNKENLQKSGLSEEDLLERIKARGTKDPKDIFFAGFESNGSFFLQKKHKEENQ